MGEIAIHVDHVSKIYKLYDKPTDRVKESLGLTTKKLSKDHYALNDLDFQVNKGETVGIIGTNGAGKSTILKIITGVLNPTRGKVDINGRISALLELGAGFNMEYTGIENVYLNGTMIGFSREEIDARMDDILKFADIGDFVYQPCKTYSSGMFVRLAFAVAINIDPEILIVDEALSVGDVFFQAKCYKKFEEFKKAGKTILFVSHDLGSISKYCDRVILLNKGTKLAEGRPREMVDMYKKVLVHQLDEAEIEHEETEEKKEIEEKEEIVENEEIEERKESIEKKDTDIFWKSRLTLNPDIQEYGEMKAEIMDIAILDHNGNITNSLEKGSIFTIKMKVKMNSDLNDPIFAVTIKNLQGTDVTGTNTFLEGVSTGTIRAGETRIISFEQRLMLQGGEYLLSFGCTGFEAGEFRVYHRLYDFCNLTVVSEKNTVGFFDMDSEVCIADV